MATASPFDAALRNVLDRLHSATRELGRHDRMPELGERAVDIALRLTGSTGSAGGALQWSVRGIPNLQVGVQRSTNLLDWED